MYAMDPVDSADSSPPSGAARAEPAAPTGLVELTPETVSSIPARTKECLSLGILAEIEQLQDAWDGVRPVDMPFDPDTVHPGGSKFLTLDGFVQRARKCKDPVAIKSVACNTGISVFESLVRVLLCCGPDVGMCEKPFARLADSIRSWQASGEFGCQAADLEVVMLMIATRGFRCSAGRIARPYAGVDQGILDCLNRIPNVKTRLERWGFQVAQLFVDFFRTIGELSVMHAWEKRATLSEEGVYSAIRTIGFFYPEYALSEDAITSIWTRACKK